MSRFESNGVYPRMDAKEMHLAIFAPQLGEVAGGRVNVARWRINGYKAEVIVWTAEEWGLLSDRPSDAQPLPSGMWCALRWE